MAGSDDRRRARREDEARADLLAHGAWPVLTELVARTPRLRFKTLSDQGDVEVTLLGGGAWSWRDRDGAEHQAEDTRRLALALGFSKLWVGPTGSRGR